LSPHIPAVSQSDGEQHGQGRCEFGYRFASDHELEILKNRAVAELVVDSFGT